VCRNYSHEQWTAVKTGVCNVNGDNVAAARHINVRSVDVVIVVIIDSDSDDGNDDNR